MAVQFGEGGDESLGKIKSASGFEKQLTWNDLLWIIRALEGETGGDTGAHSAAVVWTWAQAIVALKENGGSIPRKFGDYVEKHSQPINPIWTAEGRMCRPGGPFHGREECSAPKLERRERLRAKEWGEFSSGLQDLVVNWARGKVANPVDKSSDFAVGRLTKNKIAEGQQIFYWNSLGQGPESERGNTFVSWTPGSEQPRKSTSNWSPGHVWVELNEQRSETSTPEQVATQQGTPLSSNGTQRVVPAPPSNLDRIHAMTQGRYNPPTDTQYTYYIASGSDPNSNRIFDRPADLASPFDKFYRQINDLKTLSNLDLSSIVPVLEIWSTNEKGQLVNLTNEIFSNSPIPDVVNNPFLDHTQRFPERPLASVEDFTLTVQSPAVGGPTSISVGTLSIAVHNSSLVNDKHPKGKYISRMLRQGLYIKIKYGVSGQRVDLIGEKGTLPGIKTKTEDFFISHHEITAENDLSMKIKITLLPAASKLLNQVLIGESINISDLQGIKSEDITNSLVAALSEDTTPEQIQALKQQVNQFTRMFNNNIELIGTDGIKNRDGSLGSILHGTVTNLDIIKNHDRFDPVLVRNFVESLQGIQSSMLSRKFEQIVRKNGYLAKLKSNITVLAINLGPLFEELVLPEVKKIAEIISRTGIGISDTQEASVIGRTNVKLVFGKFNALAGERANQPISTFPVDLEDVFTFIREKRNVGRFSDSINTFIGRVASLATSPAYYTGRVDSTTPNEREETRESRTNVVDRIITPRIKFLFYPDPNDESSWLFYVYDSKEAIVNIHNLIHDLRTNKNLTDDEKKQKCAEYKIPWIELGDSNTLVSSIQASTTGDDMITSALMIAANSGVNQRRIDGQPQVPPGINVEWLAGTRDNPQEAIRMHELIMPVQMKINHFITVDTPLFAHVFIFFPIKAFSRLYTIMDLSHEVSRLGAKSNYTLQIQIV